METLRNRVQESVILKNLLTWDTLKKNAGFYVKAFRSKLMEMMPQDPAFLKLPRGFSHVPRVGEKNQKNNSKLSSYSKHFFCLEDLAV